MSTPKIAILEEQIAELHGKWACGEFSFKQLDKLESLKAKLAAAKAKLAAQGGAE